MIVDIHTHFFPDPYLDLIQSEGGRYGVELTTNQDGVRELRIRGVLHPPLKAFYDTYLYILSLQMVLEVGDQ